MTGQNILQTHTEWAKRLASSAFASNCQFWGRPLPLWHFFLPFL